MRGWKWGSAQNLITMQAGAGLPADLSACKISEVAAFGQVRVVEWLRNFLETSLAHPRLPQRLRRYTGLSHLASAARAVLVKSSHVKDV